VEESSEETMTDAQWKKELNEIRQLWIESEKRRAEVEKRAVERYEQIDRRLAATSKLLQAGAKMMLEIREMEKRLTEKMLMTPNGGKKKH
jgi:hypothetical protein